MARLCDAQRFFDLVADGEDRIERGHRFLKDQRDLRAADALHLALAERAEIASLEDDRAGGDPSGRLHEPHDRERRQRFAAARFADQAERFAGGNREADVDRPRGTNVRA